MPAHIIDMVGKRFGRMMPILDCGKNSRGMYQYLCVCDCGESKVVAGIYLRNGGSQSCGCFQRESTSARKGNQSHGKARTSVYISWQSMKTRCTNSSHKHYHRYGGRGISYDPRWETFENFYADMGDKPKGYTLERIDNSKGYSKDNCKWASRKEQLRNTISTVLLTYKGKTQCMLDWSKETGISYATIRSKLKLGWRADQIFADF
jgi:hypothetical protein